MKYPVVDGRVVTPRSLELNVARHCNLSCRSCSHLSPMSRRSLVDVERTVADVRFLSRHFRSSFVKILGGEPLLHDRLADIVRGVRATGISDTVRICTNGVLLRRVSDELLELIDDLLVSVYPGHEPDAADLASVRERAASRGVRVEVTRYRHFRESYAPRGTDDRALVRRIHATCKHVHVWRCTTLIDGHLFKCPMSAYYPVFGVMEGAWNADGLRLEDAPDFTARLAAFLNDPEPLAACGHCLGSAGRVFAHAQRGRADWLGPRDRTVEDLLDLDHLRALERDPELDDGCTASVEEDDPLRGRSTELLPAFRTVAS